MDKQSISKNINDRSLIEESINSDIKEITNTNKNFEAIYFNLLNSPEIKIPKINGVLNFLNFFDFVFNKINMEKTPNEELPNKSKISNILIEELLNNIEEIKEKNYQEKLGQYFSDLDFFKSFLDKLVKIQEISSFKQKFLIISPVSLYINLNVIIFKNLDASNGFKR